MIKQLRKGIYKFGTMGSADPVGIIVAWMSVPKKVTQELLQRTLNYHKDVVVRR
jgi:hypothetical protein